MSDVQQHTDRVQTLHEVVKKALWQAKKPRSYYFPFLEMAIDGYRKLRLNYVWEGKMWRKVTLNSLDYISFPEEMEDFIGLYQPAAGELVPLTRRDSITHTITETGGVESLDTDYEEGEDVNSPVSPGYYAPGGVNTDGYYVVDWDAEKIHVRNTTSTTLVLVYKTSGTNISTENYIPNKYIPALIAHILYEFYKFDDNYPMSRRQELLNVYSAALTELVSLEAPSHDEFMDMIRSTFYLTPKR
jgi:hypothetical protein